VKYTQVGLAYTTQRQLSKRSVGTWKERGPLELCRLTRSGSDVNHTSPEPLFTPVILWDFFYSRAYILCDTILSRLIQAHALRLPYTNTMETLPFSSLGLWATRTHAHARTHSSFK